MKDPGATRVSMVAPSWDRGVATIVFDLAQPRNSFRAADATRLSAVLDEVLAGDPRCVVLRGARGTFSAGWDVSSIDPEDDPVALLDTVVAPLCRKLRTLPVVTLSVVEGVALGFGLGLALSCDICFADEQARLGSPFRHLGMVPDSGTHHHFLQRLGYARACELIVTGRLVGGVEAERLGLVDHVAASGSAAAAAHDLALSIASGPTLAFRLSKEILLAGGGIEDVMANEGRQLARAFRSADFSEGVSAFRERRPPVFAGR